MDRYETIGLMRNGRLVWAMTTEPRDVCVNTCPPRVLANQRSRSYARRLNFNSLPVGVPEPKPENDVLPVPENRAMRRARARHERKARG